MLAITVSLPAAVPDPVRLDSGSISGTTGTSGEVRIFRGVPYAAPPIGELRWKAPQPVSKWEGIRKADEYGARCFQGGGGRRGARRRGGGGGRRGGAAGDQPRRLQRAARVHQMPDNDGGGAGRQGGQAPPAGAGAPQPTSEDCLFLNVWTPAKSASDRLPVMVWIHGAGLTGGSGSEPRYDGEELSKKGAVVITINYRLGPFGWLAHPDSVEGVRLQRVGQLRDDGFARRAAVGAEERGRLRRRPEAGDHLRRVRRRIPGVRSGRIAGRQRPLPSRDRRERRVDGHGDGEDADARGSAGGGSRKPWPRWASPRWRISG